MIGVRPEATLIATPAFLGGIMMRFPAMTVAVALIAAGAAAPLLAQDFDPMQWADKDHDGKVTLDEATQFTAGGWEYFVPGGADTAMKSSFPSFAEPTVRDVPAAADGTITREAYLAAVPQRFKAADANADGTLDEAETRRFIGMP
jgi:hypothetical protein